MAAAAVEPEPVSEAAPAAELLEDRAIAIAGGHGRRSLGRSVPGAVVGALLVVGLAFGAALGPGGALGPASDRDGTMAAVSDAGGTGTDGTGGLAGSDGDDRGYDVGDGANGEHAWEPDATANPDATGGENPDATDQPVVEPTDKPDPTPKPTEKPAATPKAPAEAIALALAIHEYHPVVEWGSCGDLDFDYYKVVRSTNSSVSWPLGAGDTLIAVIERGGDRRAYDEGAPHGVRAWYRVFCVRHTEDGYLVLRSSATKSIQVPEAPAPPPAPDPVTLGLEASLTDGGKVVLDWSACEVDGFAFYKVLGSTTGDDPSYLPWHDGTQVLGVVSEMGTTQLEVWAPDAGHTAWYRVQCIGYRGDQKVLLGESAVAAVTVP